jgi:predicted nucleic acid-binding OB-fold protein
MNSEGWGFDPALPVARRLHVSDLRRAIGGGQHRRISKTRRRRLTLQGFARLKKQTISYL